MNFHFLHHFVAKVFIVYLVIGIRSNETGSLLQFLIENEILHWPQFST